MGLGEEGAAREAEGLDLQGGGIVSKAYRDATLAQKEKMLQTWNGDPAKNKAMADRLAKWAKTPFAPLVDRECKKCGAPLHFVTNAAGGKIIPLDLRAPVYCIVYEKCDSRNMNVGVRTQLCFVSHFATCPYADEFSKGSHENRPTVPETEAVPVASYPPQPGLASASER